MKNGTMTEKDFSDCEIAFLELGDPDGWVRTDGLALIAEVRRLRAALKLYGAHAEDCYLVPCSCGFDQALQE